MALVAFTAFVAVAALPVVLTEAVPVNLEASKVSILNVMFFVPSNATVFDVTAPAILKFLAVASLVAEEALPVTPPGAIISPVTRTFFVVLI